jgi:hypothetical protein
MSAPARGVMVVMVRVVCGVQMREQKALEAQQPIWEDDSDGGGNVWESAAEVEAREARRREKELEHLTASNEHTAALSALEDDHNNVRSPRPSGPSGPALASPCAGA